MWIPISFVVGVHVTLTYQRSVNKPYGYNSDLNIPSGDTVFISEILKKMHYVKTSSYVLCAFYFECVYSIKSYQTILFFNSRNNSIMCYMKHKIEKCNTSNNHYITLLMSFTSTSNFIYLLVDFFENEVTINNLDNFVGHHISLFSVHDILVIENQKIIYSAH